MFVRYGVSVMFYWMWYIVE